MDKPKRTFRGFVESNTCRALVKINGKEQVVWLLFRPGFNWCTIADKVGLLNERGLYHEFQTDDVECIDVLDWEELPNNYGERNFGEIPIQDAP